MVNLNVLHVYRTYFPESQGGLEEVIRQICHSTKGHGANNRVFCLTKERGGKKIVRSEAEVFRGKLHVELASCGISFSSISMFKSLTNWADVIHYHFPWPFADLLNFITMCGKPMVVTYHSDIVRQQSLLKFYTPLMRHFLNSADIIVPTSMNYSKTSTVLGRYSNKLEVIPIGVDQSIYPDKYLDSISKWRKRVGSKFFFFVGVLRYYKGLHILLEALKGTSMACVIAGKGPEEKRLFDQAKELGLNNVTFLGYIEDEDKVALMSLAKAVVFPSHLRSEAFGVTLVEGLMYGKPIISCEIGTGTSYVNKHGVTGFVIPPSDPVALREAMQKLENQPGLVDQMGKAARKRYEQKFTAEEMGQAYFRLYERLLTK